MDWRSFWAELLTGIGTGLLEYDGSRTAKAALAGLEAFDAAQERRRGGDHEATRPPWVLSWDEMSDVERAAFLRSSREEQEAFLEQMAGVAPSDDGSIVKSAAAIQNQQLALHAMDLGPASPAVLAHRQPGSANPFDDWSIGIPLPFGSSGRLNIPTFRR
jgi:hypothetical protein